MTGQAPEDEGVEHADPRGAPAYLAELVGTFLLVFFIGGAISVGSNGPLQLDLAGLGLLHALLLMVLVYALGGTSGAHFNPAVTLALLSVRKISARHALIYLVTQFVGAVIAAVVVLLLFSEVGQAANYGATAINDDVLEGGSPWLGLLAEALGTFFLMLAIMGVAVNPRGESALAGVAIGGALGLAVMVFGPATGAGFNPARWFGPAVVSGSFADFWVYLLGPALGALAAALGYRALVLERRDLPPERPKDELPA